MISFSLEGKIAVITGASRGIGEAIAMTLAEYGAHCILVSRKMDGLQPVVDKINGAGGKAEAFSCNTGYPEQIAGLFETITVKYGRLDILINNAAGNPYYGPMIDAEERAWDKTFDVNLKGPFLMIQNAVRLMNVSGGGSIVNVSSINALSPLPLQGIYAITKAGLVSMTKVFAKELAGNNIRVNALLPGITETKFSEVLTEDEDLIRGIPMSRAAKPAEMAGAVLYLVSDASSYTTGSCIVCDGGITA
jgi:NAD(P)-dependent dehydrogenase (short-subunit alcohol dehydrogenase family)